MPDGGVDAGHDDRDGGDYDVVVVGGGPSGCSAAVFAARYGLNAVVFDRGRSSIRRCAYVENYLGFPAGVDVETLYALMHDHVAEAGGELVADLVESVTRADDGDGFVVETQDGRRVSARRVVAATRYDAEYLRPLDDGTMFETREHDGEEREQFDRSYPESDGTTPVDGLYVASPSDEADRQAVVAAGRGARVGLAVVGDARRDDGYPESVAKHYDWVRREAARDEEWADRDRWREWYDGRRPDDADIDDALWTDLRERDIDRRLSAYLSDDEIAERTERGQRRLLDHVDDELVVERAREIESEGAEVSS
ncbi:FAD-dependent oxidoreductase (plasmid) [Halorussus limi]|uniref:FAD-dependent oxidoreductase n=1 Tax=Halorussus limi TaxID=2938695 RepID=A0A8U0I0Q8_9EURY|nr:FAD-dependent oxidoreductase [Halorussus limi]UPV76777.1 FAD-dependent oxidoreductase [Halorussus limi]